jgi:hypothetical protein
MNRESILQAIQSKVISYTLLGGMSRADAEAKAVKAVAADLKLNKLPKLPKEASPKPGHVDDAQIRADAAFMRQHLMQPLNIELDGLAELSDDDISKLVDEWGLG